MTHDDDDCVATTTGGPGKVTDKNGDGHTTNQLHFIAARRWMQDSEQPCGKPSSRASGASRAKWNRKDEGYESETMVAKTK